MKYEVRLQRLAAYDLGRLRDFLDGVAPDAAERAAGVIQDGIESLSTFPDRGANVGDGRRKLYLPFGGSGYVVQYRVGPNEVIIARVFHMREDRQA